MRVAAIQPLGPATAELPPEQTGLVAHYPLDGDARDASGNGYHGTMRGPVPARDRFGREDGAVLFSGSDHRIDLPHEVLDGLFDVTVSFWPEDHQVRSASHPQPAPTRATTTSTSSS